MNKRYMHRKRHAMQQPINVLAEDAKFVRSLEGSRHTHNPAKIKKLTDELTVARDENKTLREGMERVNANAEKHEREMYLAQDEAERLLGRVSAQSDALYECAVALKDAGNLSRELHNLIISATEGSDETWLLRKQAEAFEAFVADVVAEQCRQRNELGVEISHTLIGQGRLEAYAQRLRTQADELESES